ncbi:hypothetical protein THAOC_29967, partial [Thalassiosira oceanica]
DVRRQYPARDRRGQGRVDRAANDRGTAGDEGEGRPRVDGLSGGGASVAGPPAPPPALVEDGPEGREEEEAGRQVAPAVAQGGRPRVQRCAASGIWLVLVSPFCGIIMWWARFMHQGMETTGLPLRKSTWGPLFETTPPPYQCQTRRRGRVLCHHGQVSNDHQATRRVPWGTEEVADVLPSIGEAGPSSSWDTEGLVHSIRSYDTEDDGLYSPCVRHRTQMKRYDSTLDRGLRRLYSLRHHKADSENTARRESRYEAPTAGIAAAAPSPTELTPADGANACTASTAFDGLDQAPPQMEAPTAGSADAALSPAYGGTANRRTRR